MQLENWINKKSTRVGKSAETFSSVFYTNPRATSQASRIQLLFTRAVPKSPYTPRCHPTRGTMVGWRVPAGSSRSLVRGAIFAPTSRSSSRRRGARGAFVGGRGERGERIRRAFHACAVLNDGKLMCWGSNGDGQLGIGSVGGSSTRPQNVDLGGTHGKGGACGASHTCAILDDDTLKCWGVKQISARVHGDQTRRSAPEATAVVNLGDNYARQRLFRAAGPMTIYLRDFGRRRSQVLGLKSELCAWTWQSGIRLRKNGSWNGAINLGSGARQRWYQPLLAIIFLHVPFSTTTQ